MGGNGKGQQQQRQYWLLKTEPECWSWQNQEESKGLSVWDGVRNPQAQKLMKSMSVDDLCLFYHTGKLREVAGIVRVVKTFYPDPTDDSGKWGAVDVREVEALKQPVTLAQMKADDHFKDFLMLRQPRLSVVSVDDGIWRRVCELGGAEKAESLGLKEAASSSMKKKKGGVKGGSGIAENSVPTETVKASTVRSKRNVPEEQPVEATGNGRADAGARTRGSKVVLDIKSKKDNKLSVKSGTEVEAISANGSTEESQAKTRSKVVNDETKQKSKQKNGTQVETAENGRTEKPQAKAGGRKRGSKEVIAEPNRESKEVVDEPKKKSKPLPKNGTVIDEPPTGSRPQRIRKKKVL